MVKVWERAFWQKRSVHLVLGVVFLLTCFGVGLLLFPLEISKFQVHYSLWKNQVKSTQLGSIHGFLRDQCSGDKSLAGPGDCYCVAMIHDRGDSSLGWRRILEWPTEDWAKRGLGHPIRMYALDLPGALNSTAQNDMASYPVRKLAAEIREAIRPVCTHWVAVGNGLGGWVATWLALDWPDGESGGVSRLLLLSPMGFKSGFRTAQPSVPVPLQPDDYLDSRMSALKVPLMFVWGKEDRITPLEVGHQIRDFARTAIWREANECGHFPQRECPHVVVQSIIDMINFGAM